MTQLAIHLDIDRPGTPALPDALREGAPKLLFVDAFAGCGGLSLGLIRAGWQGLLAIEKDRQAFATLLANLHDGSPDTAFLWPDSIETRPWDIDTLLASHRAALEAMAGTVDLLAGAPPCQGFSFAGRRQHADPRNTLFRSFLNLVDVLRPRAVLFENVHGFTARFGGSTAHENDFAWALCNTLSKSYQIAHRTLCTHDFGVPQSRQRFFVVGILKSLPKSRHLSTFFERLRFNADTFLSARGMPLRPNASDALSDLETGRNGIVPYPDNNAYQCIDYQGPITRFQSVMGTGLKGALTDTRLARNRPEITDRFRHIIDYCQQSGFVNAQLPEQKRAELGMRKIALRVLDPTAPAPTITSLPEDLLHYCEPRTLTVRENARLQSFPDWFAFQGNYTTGGSRRRREVPRFTQVANAIPPLLAEQLGIALMRLLAQAEGPR